MSEQFTTNEFLDDEIGAKPFWYSKTLIGALIATVASIVQQLGLITDTTPIIAMSDEIFQLIGLALVVYGRVTVKNSLKLK